MAQAVVRVEGLPAAPLDAAAQFHREHVESVRRAVSAADAVALVFPSAGHEHRAWRLAAVQELAREASPKRVNAVVGEGEAAIVEAVGFLEASPGITGQLLTVDGKTGETR